MQPTTSVSVFGTIRSLLFGSIIGPAVLLLMAVALLYFLWGVVTFIMNADNPEGRSNGAKHMIWGSIGLAIMLSAFGIATFLFNSVISVGGNKGVNDAPIQTPGILVPGNQGF
ncbi:MAG: hypothetical protein M3Q63_01265 [bacterium]|nr:hypothetical protein [bacterium]